MASLFANRNRRSGRDRYRAASGNASNRSRRTGRGLIAPNRNATGAASGETRINAARKGTLMQHELQQSNEQHRSNQRLASLQHDRGRQEMKYNKEMQPLRIEGAKLQNKGTREMQPLQKEGAKLQNQGREHETKQKQWQDRQTREEYRNTAGLRKRERASQEDILKAKNTITGAKDISYNEQGDIVARHEDEYGHPREEVIQRDVAAAAGFQVPDIEGTRQKEMEIGAEQQQHEQQVTGRAQQTAARIMEEGGSIDAALAEMEDLPPEQYSQVRSQVIQQLLPEYEQLENRDHGKSMMQRATSLIHPLAPLAFENKSDKLKNMKKAFQEAGIDPDRTMDDMKEGAQWAQENINSDDPEVRRQAQEIMAKNPFAQRMQNTSGRGLMR